VFIWDAANNRFEVLTDFTYDSTHNALGLGLYSMMLSDKATSTSSGVTPLKVIDNSPNNVLGMFVDYVIENVTSGGFRAGTLRSTHTGGNTVYDETSTADIGGSTSGIRLLTDISGTDFRLLANNGDGSSYNITFSIKLIRV
jgi:hypothetical protein